MNTDRPDRRLTGSDLLIVDDEPHIQDVVSRALAAAGYAIDCASVGRETLRLASMGGYGLIVLDLVMPDMDGRAVLAGLLRVHRTRPC